jgi:hypothetical protein
MILRVLIIGLFVLFMKNMNAQIINYVNNPSFETSLPTATLNGFEAAEFWGPIDTSSISYILFGKPPIGAAPYVSYGFQYPKTGDNFIYSQFYCNTCIRGYPRNRLKQSLKPNQSYCAKYYVVNTNNNRVAIDSYGIFFGDSTIDTITKCNVPIEYLNPQVQNLNGNIIIDTLNWIPITGTFVANGTEKYLILGNFKSNAATNTLLLNTPLTIMSNDIYLDDVSLIELNLPAFAGRDTSVIPGDSIFIGREPDIGIDEACVWYKWPNMTTAIDTVAGFWIKPVTSCTYMVRQQLWCTNSPKWDTVVIHMNPVDIKKLQLIYDAFKLFPIPAKDELQLSIQNTDLLKDFQSIFIFNNLGLLIREEELKFENGFLKIKTEDLPNGVYSLQLKSSSNETVSKRFVISR